MPKDLQMPAITIKLRDLPKRLVITCEGNTVEFVHEEGDVESDVSGLKNFKNAFLSSTLRSAAMNFDAEAAVKTFKITRSDDGVKVTINGVVIMFNNKKEANVTLSQGDNELLAYITGMPGKKGSVTVEGLPTANLEIKNGANSEYGTITIRV